jgi:anti-sigma B factor antagonist
MLNITVTEMHRVDVVIPEGIVNSDSASQLDAMLNERLDHTEHHNLVIDLSGVTYMSSAGLRALVGAMKRAHESGGNLVIASPSPRVQEVLELAGLTEVFSIYEERLSAVGSF